MKAESCKDGVKPFTARDLSLPSSSLVMPIRKLRLPLMDWKLELQHRGY